jgi:hypothetical protein
MPVASISVLSTVDQSSQPSDSQSKSKKAHSRLTRHDRNGSLEAQLSGSPSSSNLNLIKRPGNRKASYQVEVA